MRRPLSPLGPFGNPFAATLASFIDEAAVDPLRAMRRWLDEMSSPASRVVLDMRQRGLALVARGARHVVKPDCVDELDDLIEKAALAIEEAIQTAHPPTRLSLRAGDKHDIRQDGETMAAANRYRYSTEVERLGTVASSWSDDQWLEWLSAGFVIIEDSAATAHLAFPPLRLYPLGSFVEQLGAAITSSEGLGSPMQERVLLAVQKHLQAGGSNAHRDDVNFWKLFHELKPEDPTFSVGMAYIDHVGKRARDDVLSLICDTAWDCNGTPSSRSQFFERLERKTGSLRVTAAVVASNLDEAFIDTGKASDDLPYSASVAQATLDEHLPDIAAPLDELIAQGRLARLGSDIRDTNTLRKWLAPRARDEEAIWDPPTPLPLPDLEPHHGL